MSKRKTEISIINVLMCLIVVLIHVMSEPLSQTGTDMRGYNAYQTISRLTAFVVQGFIFLSGMKLFLNGRRERYGVFMLKRVKDIVIPYVIAVFAYFVYLVYVMKYFPFEWGRLGLYMVRGNIVSPFYFIIVIIQFYLLYPLWKLILDRVGARAALVCTVILTVVFGMYGVFVLNAAGVHFKYLDRVFLVYLMYWTGGMYAGQNYDAFIRWVKRCRPLIFALTPAAAAADAVTYVMYCRNIIRPTHLNTVHAFYVCMIILMCFAVFSGIKKEPRGLLRVLDRSSYYIFLSHVLFIYVLRHDINLPAASSVTAGFIRDAALVYAAVIVFACMVYFIKKAVSLRTRIN